MADDTTTGNSAKPRTRSPSNPSMGLEEAIRRAGVLHDIRDMRFDYVRASPEKALLDWIYLGVSSRSRMTRPPLDLETRPLNAARLKRVAKRMGIFELLKEWQDEQARYQTDPDVRENASRLLVY